MAHGRSVHRVSCYPLEGSGSVLLSLAQSVLGSVEVVDPGLPDGILAVLMEDDKAASFAVGWSSGLWRDTGRRGLADQGRHDPCG